MRTPVEHRAADGTVTYKIRYRHGGRQTSRTFRLKKDALTFAALLENSVTDALAWVEARENAVTEFTFAQWHEHYVHQLTDITERTREDYRALRRRYLAELDPLPITLISRVHVTNLVNRLVREDKSPKTIRNVVHMLSSSLTLAVEEGHITRNPCRKVRLPTRSLSDKEAHYLTPAEFEALVEATPAHYQPLVLLLGGTGLRWSEATALMGEHVNGNLLTVRQAWKRIPGGWEIGVPKSKKSQRTVVLPPRVVEALDPLPKRGTLIFRTPLGNPVRHSNFRKRVWVPACERAGLDPAPNIHALRHSSVSWLIAAGIPLPVIQARLGHEKITTTIDTYGHLLPDLHLAAAEAANLALGGGRTT